MASGSIVSAELKICGYCFEHTVNLKSLPCTHVFCATCLKKYLEKTKVLKCGNCRATYDTSISELPSLDTADLACDSCKQKDITEKATVYCRQCSRRFCAKHQEGHGDIFPDHHVIHIDEYVREKNRLEPRYCKTHTSVVVSLACEMCQSVLCAQCMDDKDGCPKGSRHQAVSLTALVKRLRVRFSALKTEAQKKEGELSTLLKKSHVTLAEIDKETGEQKELLHKTRDEQIEAIKAKYDEIETEFMTHRQNFRQEVVNFMDEEVAKRLDSLSVEIQRLDVSVKSSHEVDVVNRFEELETELKQLTLEGLPKLPTKNLPKLKVKGEYRTVEIEINYDLSSIHFAKEVQLPTAFNRLHPMNDIAYLISRSSDIHSLDINNLTTKIIKKSFIADAVNGMTGCNNEIYLLHYGNPWRIFVCDLNGKLLRQWDHHDSSKKNNLLSVVGDRIVVRNCGKRTVSVYTLLGEVIREIPFNSDGDTKGICPVKADRVAISVNSTVSLINISSGQVVWTSAAVKEPRSVVCYRDSRILVGGKDGEVSELDCNTGKCVKTHLGNVEDVDSASICGDKLVTVCGKSLKIYNIL